MLRNAVDKMNRIHLNLEVDTKLLTINGDINHHRIACAALLLRSLTFYDLPNAMDIDYRVQQLFAISNVHT